MAYRLVVLPTAEADLERLDEHLRQRVLRRLVWLRENAAAVVHHHLTNMPADLTGLCRLRVADYRVLYWHDPQRSTIKVYRVQHRRDVYRGL